MQVANEIVDGTRQHGAESIEAAESPRTSPTQYVPDTTADTNVPRKEHCAPISTNAAKAVESGVSVKRAEEDFAELSRELSH
ncbi:MAG: hypothetical protein Q9187_005871, partial [Circinaria calcarea]